MAGHLSFTASYDKDMPKIVQQFMRKYPEIISKEVKKVASFAIRNIVKLTPVKTGAARASWILEPDADPFVYRVLSAIGRGVNYIKNLELGTGIWREGGSVITPKKGEYLVFPIIQGNTILRWVKTKSTNGQMGHFMVQRTVRDAKGKLTSGLKNAIKKEWGKQYASGI